MAANDFDPSSSSDSEPENVQQIVRNAETRLGQKKARRAAEKRKPATKVPHLEKYTRQATLSQKKLKVRRVLAASR